MASEVIPQSRRTKSSGVPAKADMPSLSKMASLGRGATSGMIAKPAESRRNRDRTCAGSSTRCQAMAVRIWERPIRPVGKDMWRQKKILMLAALAASITLATGSITGRRDEACSKMPTCMS